MIYVAIAGILFVLLMVAKISKQAKKNAAVRAEEQAKAARQEEAKRKITEEKRKQEERDQESKRIVAEREAAIERGLEKFPDARSWRLEKMQTETNSDLLTITQFTPISKRRYVAFDLETTGLSQGDDAIVEIAAVRVVNGEVTDEYQQLVDPRKPMPAEAQEINHITDDMLKGKPTIYEALPSFLSFIGDDVLAAHNARFDAKFLAQACMIGRFKTPSRYFDTMELARYWPEAENKKLGTLLAAAGIENDDAHRALGDARAVASLISATNERRAEQRRSSKT